MIISFGREVPNSRFHGGAIYNDSDTGTIWVKNQILLGSGETLEEWLWDQASVEVQHYHGDNGILTAYIFCKYCDKRSQHQFFLVLEHSIRRLMWNV